jgi:hypothetical protein
VSEDFENPFALGLMFKTLAILSLNNPSHEHTARLINDCLNDRLGSTRRNADWCLAWGVLKNRHKKA